MPYGFLFKRTFAATHPIKHDFHHFFKYLYFQKVNIVQVRKLTGCEKVKAQWKI